MLGIEVEVCNKPKNRKHQPKPTEPCPKFCFGFNFNFLKPKYFDFDFGVPHKYTDLIKTEPKYIKY